jgi:translation initiation factor 2 subunit 2
MITVDLKEYERNLDLALSQLPQAKEARDRFEMPKLQVTVSGNRTTIANFKEVCDAINRDPTHVMKFLAKEMATSGTIEAGRVVFQGKFWEDALTRLMDRYVKEFVICSTCGRPDTKIVKQERFFFLVCEACGARAPMRHI